MNNENKKRQMLWGREGLHVTDWTGAKVCVLDCYDLAVLKINYNDDLDVVPPGWYMSRRERVEKWIQEGKAKL